VNRILPWALGLAGGGTLWVLALFPPGAGGAALPVEYAIPPAGAHKECWQAVLASVRATNRRKVGAARLRPDESELVDVQELPFEQLAVVVIRRWSGPPHAVLEPLDVVSGGAPRCTARAELSTWVPLSAAVDETSRERRLAWMVREGIACGVFVGAGLVDPSPCRALDVAASREAVPRHWDRPPAGGDGPWGAES
jgi:hypothetical protein